MARTVWIWATVVGAALAIGSAPIKGQSPKAGAAAGQSPKQVIADDQLRQWAESASSAALGDSEAFQAKMSASIRSVAPDFWKAGELPFVVIHSDDAIKVYAVGPITNFFFQAQEFARRLEPTAKLKINPEVEISISPDQISAPDFDRVVLRRGEQIVPPLRSTLKPTPMETRMGAKRVIHSGSVFYPLSAFAPGELVTILLIPVTGGNVVRPIHGPEIDKLLLGFDFSSGRS